MILVIDSDDDIKKSFNLDLFCKGRTFHHYLNIVIFIVVVVVVIITMNKIVQ